MYKKQINEMKWKTIPLYYIIRSRDDIVIIIKETAIVFWFAVVTDTV